MVNYMERNVTIVIPVYKDWKTLQICIESIKKYVNSRHQIFLINDMSSEWEKMEREIKKSIDGCVQFHYFRNKENLGFVKTCNLAVQELDKTDNDILLLNSDTEVTEGFLEEMLYVLYAAEKHGVVCPRSNNATLLTVPVKSELKREISTKESYNIYEQVKGILPRQQVIPTGVGFAFLIKRDLIEQYGLFDEIYSPGYNEENDFCMRINQYGFNTLVANRAYVFHHESKSFGQRKIKLDRDHSLILTKRFPYYWDRVDMYFSYQMSVVDYFADLIAQGVYEKPRVLISLYEMPAAHNGTAQHGLLFLENFYKLFREKYNIDVLINRCANQFFGISQKYSNVYLPDQLTNRYHIAYVPSQIIHVEHLHILNRTCLRYAFCMQDIISIRSGYLLVEDWEREEVFKKSIKYCDGIIPFSRFSLEDMKDYYSQEFEKRNIFTKVVYLAAVEENIDGDINLKIPFKSYFVVLGNQYKHKYLDILTVFLKSSKYNFILIGAKETGHLEKNIYGFKSGNLNGTVIDSLFRKSMGIIFPSVYEGFGLPILNSIKYKKHIVINDNPLNREQMEALDYYKNNIHLFKRGNEIEKYLDAISVDPVAKISQKYRERTWQDVATEVEMALDYILKQPIEIRKLEERWEEMRYLERIHKCYVAVPNSYINSELRRKLVGILKTKMPFFYKILKKIKDNVSR